MEPVVTLNGVQLHPPNPDGTGYELDEDGIQGWYGSPKRKSSFTPRTSEAGSWWSPLAKKDVRVIPISGTLIEADVPDLEAVEETLAAICPEADQLYELRVVSDRGTRIAHVQCTDEILVKPQGPNSVAFSLSLTAPDPLKYDDTPNNGGSITLASTVGGLDWSAGLHWPLHWGDSTSDGTGTLINSGSAPSWPLFTISGPTDLGSLSMPSVTNTSTGQSIVYGGALNVGDVLVIDTNPATRSAILNGSVDVWTGMQVSQWFQVPARGQVKIQFQGVSGSLTPTLVPITPNAYY